MDTGWNNWIRAWIAACIAVALALVTIVVTVVVGHNDSQSMREHEQQVVACVQAGMQYVSGNCERS